MVSAFGSTPALTGIQRTLAQVLGADRPLDYELLDRPLDVLIDRAELEQVIVNLALNARDATEPGDRLTLRTSIVQIDATSAGRPGVAIREGQYAELAFSDTGHGMDARTLAHMFEPATRAKAWGLAPGWGWRWCTGW